MKPVKQEPSTRSEAGYTWTRKFHFPLARQVSNLTRVHDFGNCCQKQPDFFPATEGTGLILSRQLRSSNGPVSLIIAYSPRLDSRLRPSIGSTMTPAIIGSIPGERTTFLLGDFNVRAGTNHDSCPYFLCHFGTG